LDQIEEFSVTARRQTAASVQEMKLSGFLPKAATPIVQESRFMFA